MTEKKFSGDRPLALETRSSLLCPRRTCALEPPMTFLILSAHSDTQPVAVEPRGQLTHNIRGQGLRLYLWLLNKTWHWWWRSTFSYL